MKESAKILVKENFDQSTNSQTEEQIRDKLQKLPGVGPKVADCVLGFSQGFANVTPIDVWTKRILREVYKLPGNWKYEKYSQWINRNFKYAAWAFQFLFEYYRKKEGFEF